MCTSHCLNTQPGWRPYLSWPSPPQRFEFKKIVEQAVARDYTDIMVLNDDQGVPTGLWLVHLPNGPTAHFKLSRYP